MLRLLGRGLVTVPREASPGRDPMVIVSEDSKGRDLLLFPERDPRVIVFRMGSQGRDVIFMYLSSTRFLKLHLHIFIKQHSVRSYRTYIIHNSLISTCKCISLCSCNIGGYQVVEIYSRCTQGILATKLHGHPLYKQYIVLALGPFQAVSRSSF